MSKSQCNSSLILSYCCECSDWIYTFRDIRYSCPSCTLFHIPSQAQVRPRGHLPRDNLPVFLVSGVINLFYDGPDELFFVWLPHILAKINDIFVHIIKIG